MDSCVGLIKEVYYITILSMIVTSCLFMTEDRYEVPLVDKLALCIYNR